MVKVFDLIFFARPMPIIPAWTVYLHYIAACRSTDYIRFYPETVVSIHLAILTMIVAAAYVINQIFDVETDRVNEKLFFLPDRIISILTAWIYYLILAVSGILITILAYPDIVLAVAAFIVLGIVYSVPGFRLKDRPVAGLLANAVGFGLIVPWIAAWVCQTTNVQLAALPYFFAIATGYVLTTIPDRPGDTAAGKRTVAVILGQRGSLWLAMIFTVITAAVSIWQANYEMAITAAITMTGLGYLLVSFNQKWLMITSKLPIFVLTLFAGAHFPFYLAILLLTTILTRVYYKHRFGIVYPKLG